MNMFENLVKLELGENKLHAMFAYIVEDPFESKTLGGMVRVDDHNNVYVDNKLQWGLLHDELLPVLFREWADFNGLTGRKVLN